MRKPKPLRVIDTTDDTTDEDEEPKKKSASMPWWATLLVATIPTAITSFVSLQKSAMSEKTSAAKAEASYQATVQAVEKLQEHDDEHMKQDAATAAHIDAIERWLQSMSTGRAMHFETPNAPLAPPPAKKITMPATVDDVIEAIKEGKGSPYVKEIYEGPEESAPAWTKEFERRANMKAVKK